MKGTTTRAPAAYNVRITGSDGSDQSGRHDNNAKDESQSTEHIVPLSAVHVRSDITNVYSPLDERNS